MRPSMNRHLQSSSSSGRQTFGSFDVSPFNGVCATTSTNFVVVAEQVRSAIEDCLRIVMMDQNECSWTDTTVSYIGLGNVICHSDTTTTTTTTTTTSNTNDTVTIKGGVIDFIETTTTTNRIPSLSEIIDCLDIAIRSTTCLESIQYYFPTVDQLDYNYHSSDNDDNRVDTTTTTTTPPPTLTPPQWMTESDDIVSSPIAQNRNDTSTTSTTTTSFSLVIPLAVVGSCAILIAMMGFLWLSKIKSRPKQQRRKSDHVHDITTNTAEDHNDSNSSSSNSSNSSSNSNNVDVESGTVMEISNPNDVERMIVSDDDDEGTPTTNEDWRIPCDDFDNDVMKNTTSTTTSIRPIENPIVHRIQYNAIDDDENGNGEIIGYVSSDSDTEVDSHLLEAQIGTLLVGATNTHHDESQFHTDGNKVTSRKNEEDEPIPNQDHCIIQVPSSVVHDSTVALIGQKDNDEDDEEEFVLDHSWDPDDNSITSTNDIVLDDKDSFSVTKKQNVILTSSVIKPQRSSPTQQQQQRRSSSSNNNTNPSNRSKKSFTIQRRKKVMTPTSKNDTECHHKNNHPQQHHQHYHDDDESRTTVDESTTLVEIPPVPQKSEQFRRSRSFVILLPTNTNHPYHNVSSSTTTKARCRSTPRPLLR